MTSRIGVTRHVFTTFCQNLESETKRKACEAVKDIHAQELREARAAGKAAATSTTTPKPTTPPARTYGDGAYDVGSEIQPGTHKTSGGECYWERLKGFSGDFEDILTNGNISGPSRMTIRSTDKGVTFSGGCGWQRV